MSIYIYTQLHESVSAQRKNHETVTLITKGVFELNLLTAEHLTSRSLRSEIQWKKRHASLTNQLLIAYRDFDKESGKFLLRARHNLVNLRVRFFKVVVAEKKLNSESAEKTQKLINTLAVQIRLISQQVLSDVNRAGSVNLDLLEHLENKINNILAVIMVTVVLIVIGMLIWIQVYLISPIFKLKSYAEKLIDGDYHVKTTVRSKNEIGDLGASFNSLSITVAEKIDDLLNRTKLLEESKKQTEYALEVAKSAERQYKDIFTAAADAIFTIDDKGIILTANPASEILFGYESNELIGKNIKIITSPEHYENHDQYIKNYIDTGVKKVIGTAVQVEGKHKDGMLIPVHLRVSDMKRNGKSEFIGVIRDLREELIAKQEADKAKELLEVTNKELESYAYSISHDLRSPLRSIDGFSLVLLEDYADSLDDDAKDYLNRIRAGSKKMSDLITELLNISRIMKEGMKIVEIDLAELAQEEMKQLKLNNGENKIEFSCDSSMLVYGDMPLLQSVVENLLNNAVKYSKRNEVIEIEMGMQIKDGDRIFYVKDNGAGFDMKHKSKLFKPFQRLHKVNQFEGSGIGLATVQRIIARHDGQIWAESEVDKGAVFYFTLNLTDTSEVLES